MHYVFKVPHIDLKVNSFNTYDIEKEIETGIISHHR